MNSVKCKKVQSPFPGLQKQALPVSVSSVLTLYTTIMDKILNSRAFFQFKMPKPTSTPKQRWKLASKGGGGGEGELQAIFELFSSYFRKGCTVLSEHPEIIENYEYCITLPRNFVQDRR